jgi:hypothetical protein
MARAYPGYVYRPYPRMISDLKLVPLGYKIVGSEEEEKALLLSLNPIKEPEVVEEKKTRTRGPNKPKLMFEEA